jgi:hypothetical protein
MAAKGEVDSVTVKKAGPSRDYEIGHRYSPSTLSLQASLGQFARVYHSNSFLPGTQGFAQLMDDGYGIGSGSGTD